MSERHLFDNPQHQARPKAGRASRHEAPPGGDRLDGLIAQLAKGRIPFTAQAVAELADIDLTTARASISRGVTAGTIRPLPRRSAEGEFPVDNWIGC